MKTGGGTGYAQAVAARTVRSATEWCAEPDVKFAPGRPEAPSIVAPDREARTAESVHRGCPVRLPLGGRSHGGAVRAVLWAGRAQEDGRGLPGHAPAGPAPAQGGADLRDDDRRPARARRLAGGGRLHPRSDGEHGGVLAADLESVGGPLRTAPGQRPAHQSRPGPEDGRPGLRVDRRPPAAWPAARECGARAGAAGTARADAVSHVAHPGASGRGQSPAEGARGGQHHR